jgi:putative hydrolases of HD superfamily
VQLERLLRAGIAAVAEARCERAGRALVDRIEQLLAGALQCGDRDGELKPGSQLPSGGELARSFGVARMTVTAAIRVLREEGYIRSQAGSGVFVREMAALPAPSEEHPLAGLASFVYEAGYLKRLPRSGWLLAGIEQPETVAEHSFRATVLGVLLAGMAGADAGRTAALCAVHDMAETRIADVHSVGRAYITVASPQAVAAHQAAGMPTDVAKVFEALVAEYEENETAEARLAHDADKLDTLATACEYAAQGFDTGAWRQSSIEALRTEEGKQLAQAIDSTEPGSWLAAFQASYHELRANAKQRGHRLEGPSAGPE